MIERPTSTAAISTVPACAARKLVDDPLDLDDDELAEILRNVHRRSSLLGLTTGVATIALTALLGPATWAAAFVAVPAYVIGYSLSARAARTTAAAQLGLTPRCLGHIERSCHKASLRREAWRMRLRNWRSPDFALLARLTREEIARAGAEARALGLPVSAFAFVALAFAARRRR